MAKGTFHAFGSNSGQEGGKGEEEGRDEEGRGQEEERGKRGEGEGRGREGRSKSTLSTGHLSPLGKMNQRTESTGAA